MHRTIIKGRRSTSAKIVRHTKRQLKRPSDKIQVDKPGRQPPQRLLYPEDSRPLFDGEHPGPIAPKLVITHRVVDDENNPIPFEFEHREDAFTLKHSEENPDEILLYFRRKRRLRAAGDVKQEGKMGTFEIAPRIGTTMTLQNVSSGTTWKVTIGGWFQKKRYQSGYCTVTDAGSAMSSSSSSSSSSS